MSRHWETGRIRVPGWLTLFEGGLSGEPPDTHNVVVEQLAVEPEEKTPDDMRVSSEEESADLPIDRRQVQETQHKQANRQAQCVYTFSQRAEL